MPHTALWALCECVCVRVCTCACVCELALSGEASQTFRRRRCVGVEPVESVDSRATSPRAYVCGDRKIANGYVRSGALAHAHACNQCARSEESPSARTHAHTCMHHRLRRLCTQHCTSMRVQAITKVLVITFEHVRPCVCAPRRILYIEQTTNELN